MSAPTAETPNETCGECGFGGSLFSDADVVSTLQLQPAIWDAAIEGLDSTICHQRPDQVACWSIAELFEHVRLVAFGNRFAIDSAINEPGVDLGDPPPVDFSELPATFDFDALKAALSSETGALASRLSELETSEWDNAVTTEGITRTVRWHARHTAHEFHHHLGDIGRVRLLIGHGPSPEVGQITQLNTSGGGVPKNAVDHARIGLTGMSGDDQNDSVHHGRPFQALCLWSEDVLAALRDEGHPIEAGFAGENITVSGITWAELRPGTRIIVGDIPLLITAHAVPCAKNAAWFVDRNFRRMDHPKHPGWSRLYAVPLASGELRPGDRVEISAEPPHG